MSNEFYNKKLGISESSIKSETDTLILKNIMLSLEKEIAETNMRINAAKLRAINGNYSDTNWFNGISGYKKTLGVLKNTCQFRMGELRIIHKQESKKQGHAFNKYLIEKLKESISEKKFEKILNKAKDEFF